ncbi:MAG: ABC transporter permease [Deltaproteobacteria bacterium]|nr:ABC transporter permease [Deltaproteobacteria bacterium]
MKSLPFRIAFIALLFLALGGALAPWVAPYNPDTITLSEQLSPPNSEHWFGQDRLGRDILSRWLYSARLSLSISFFVVLLSLTFGALIGMISGYRGGWLDEILMRMVDILLAFPGLLLAIALTAVMGPSLFNIIFALSLLGWTSYARLARTQTLSLKNRDYIQATQALGTPIRRIFLKHLLPNLAGPLLVQATFSLAGVILAESSLSFLGLGPQNHPTWGGMLSEGVEYLFRAPTLSIFPGIAIMASVLSLNILGDQLRDKLDPKSKHL